MFGGGEEVVVLLGAGLFAPGGRIDARRFKTPRHDLAAGAAQGSRSSRRGHPPGVELSS